ncbi:MAG TPA: winged helix DNA-binding domain-containing protein [Vicinamibacteria bacterium]|nr:winged helix DNA-binding domain-containing protein [Vicinamibacteria bacterium]
MSAGTDVLTGRALGRATLARQMLLARQKVTPLQAVERLAGLQAQLARPPFIALWSRLLRFAPEALVRLARDRKVVRATMMRGTLHLVTTEDYLAFRPVLQPMLSAGMAAVLKDRARDLDLEKLAAAARTCVDEQPRTFEDIRAVLHAAWPKVDERAMGYAVRMHLPLVQVPADTRWGWPGAACFAAAESWIGRPLAAEGKLEALILRYLAAFGPASVADAQTWSGLRGLKDTFQALRPRLRTFGDERGRELFDLPRAPRPPADTPAPVRFLPDFDALLLGYQDRARVLRPEHGARVTTANLRVQPTFLVDGLVGGTWRVERTKSKAVLLVEPFLPVPKTARAELVAEGTALLRFMESDATATAVTIG